MTPAAEVAVATVMGTKLGGIESDEMEVEKDDTPKNLKSVCGQVIGQVHTNVASTYPRICFEVANSIDCEGGRGELYIYMFRFVAVFASSSRKATLCLPCTTFFSGRCSSCARKLELLPTIVSTKSDDKKQEKQSSP